MGFWTVFARFSVIQDTQPDQPHGRQVSPATKTLNKTKSKVGNLTDRLKSLVDVETGRAEQTAALVAELDRQMQALGNLGGDDSKKYRQTVWFDWVKAKAEHAYVTAHLAALREVLGS